MTTQEFYKTFKKDRHKCEKLSLQEKRIQNPHKTQINDMQEAVKKASLKLELGENTKGVDKDLER